MYNLFNKKRGGTDYAARVPYRAYPISYPKFSMDESDIGGFMDELKTYHEEFQGLLFT